jgi:hypothetical protein
MQARLLSLVFLLATAFASSAQQCYQFKANTGNPYSPLEAHHPYPPPMVLTVKIASLPPPIYANAEGSKPPSTGYFKVFNALGAYGNSVTFTIAGEAQPPQYVTLNMSHDGSTSSIGFLADRFQLVLVGPVALFSDLTLPATLPPLTAYKFATLNYAQIDSISSNCSEEPQCGFARWSAESARVNELATNIEHNEADFYAAVDDIKTNGMDSQYAQLTYARVDLSRVWYFRGVHIDGDTSLPDAFEALTVEQALRDDLVAALRGASKNMEKIAEVKDRRLSSTYQLFCSLDPQHIDPDSLAMALALGFIDEKTFLSLGYDPDLTAKFRAALNDIVLTAALVPLNEGAIAFKIVTTLKGTIGVSRASGVWLKSWRAWMARQLPRGVTSERISLIANIKNAKLRNAIEDLYRPALKTIAGDGGTADAIRYERATGTLLSPAGHLPKGRLMITTLRNIATQQSLDQTERDIVGFLVDDLTAAINGK